MALSRQNQRIANKSRVLSPALGALCSLVRARPGARICCWVDDLKLQQLHDASPIAQHADPGPSLSLRSLLETHRLSNRMKLVLAYIIARSFWQYYDSPWMNTKWSSDTVHFLPERGADDEEGEDLENAGGRKDLYASKPYYVVEFTDEPGHFTEYCDSYSVIYRYPRLLALCIMLLEIGRGESLPVDESLSMEAALNNNWNLAKRLVDKPKAWGDFDYVEYRKVVSQCLNRKLFDDASQLDADSRPDVDVVSRKAVLYECVVSPLENLLKVLGFWDSLYDVSPIDPRGPGPTLGIPPPAPVPSGLGGAETSHSASWLQQVASINSYIFKLSRQSDRSKNTSRPIRMAILDTGYDAEAVFFGVSSRRQRLKGWKDFVASSEAPIDETGHGTHTVALAMKTAPLADIYAARVAREKVGLRNAAESIKDVSELWRTACDPV